MVASGSDLDAGTCNNSDSAESGIEIHKSHVSDKTVKNGACGAQVEAQIVQKLVKGVPSSPHRASKCSQINLGPSNWYAFRTSWTTLTHYASRLLPACSYHFKTTLPDCLNRPAELLRLLNRPSEIFRQCIRSHCSPGLGRLGCFGCALGNSAG